MISQDNYMFFLYKGTVSVDSIDHNEFMTPAADFSDAVSKLIKFFVRVMMMHTQEGVDLRAALDDMVEQINSEYEGEYEDVQADAARLGVDIGEWYDEYGEDPQRMLMMLLVTTVLSGYGALCTVFRPVDNFGYIGVARYDRDDILREIYSQYAALGEA